MQTLYDITAEFMALYEMGEDEEAFKDSLESLNFDLALKGQSYIHVMKQLEMEKEEALRVADAFKKKAEVRDHNIKAMKDRLKVAMEMLDKKKIEAGGYTIYLKGNGGQQAIVYDGKVPDNMKRVELVEDPEKIRAYLKEHPDCEWAHFKERGKHIEVK